MPIWWDESERVAFNAKARISKSKAAIDRAQDAASSKKPVPGRYFIAEPVVTDGGDFPTREEWLEEQAIKNGKQKTISKFDDSSKMSIIQGRK